MLTIWTERDANQKSREFAKSFFYPSLILIARRGRILHNFLATLEESHNFIAIMRLLKAFLVKYAVTVPRKRVGIS
jgi:hypothetical protein